MIELELETIIVSIAMGIIIVYLVWQIIKMKLTHETKIKNAREDTANRQRAIVKGDISETLAPGLLAV